MPKALTGSSELMVEKVGIREMNKEGKHPPTDNHCPCFHVFTIHTIYALSIRFSIFILSFY